MTVGCRQAFAWVSLRAREFNSLCCSVEMWLTCDENPIAQTVEGDNRVHLKKSWWSVCKGSLF